LDLIIFDLDGTLVDSRQDLANAVNATRRHMGKEPLENERVYSYVGNGAPVLIRRSLGEQASEAEVQEALEFFLEFYRDHDLDHTRLYPGVREALDRLREAGKRMAVLTNKPSRMSRHIVEGLGVASYFFQVYGGNSFEFKKPHPVGVEALRKEAGAGRAATLMVGDSSVDVLTARNAGIPCCCVTYGFQPESLADPAPDRLIDRMEQLAEWLLGPGRPPMNQRPGAAVTVSGIYWCTVCKLPQTYVAGAQFPECPNMCARGTWQLIERLEEDPSRALD
jgi:phosphoglycolate phosphatase